MKKLKFNFHLWSKSLFLGASFLVFSLIASVYWGFIYAEDLTSNNGVITNDGGIVVQTVPSAPSNLSYSNLSSTKVYLFWSDNSSNEDKFNIERKINTTSLSSSSNDYWMPLVLVPGENITTYEDNTVSPGVSYSYRVQACLSNFGCSSFSTLENVVVPPLIENTNCTEVKLVLDNNKTLYTAGENVNYTWTCYPAGTSANVYVSLKKPDGTFMIVNNYSGGVPSGGIQTGVLSTANFVAGNYSLKACLTTSCVADANISGQTFTVVMPTSGPSIPAAPSDLTNDTLTSSSNSITIRWKDNSDNELKFRIKRKLSSEASYSSSYRYTYANINYLVDSSSITADTPYDYSVSACSSESTCSPEVELKGVRIPLPTVETPNTPAPVTNLTNETLTSASTYIMLKWVDNSSVTSNRFISISRKASGENDFKILSRITTSGVNYYKDTSVTKGVRYDYRVKACYTDSLCSSPVELIGLLIPLTTTTANPDTNVITPTAPAAPSEVSKVINYTSTYNTVTLKWKDNSSTEDRFIIERRSSLSTNFTQLSYVKANVVSYTDSIEMGVYYEYRLKACYTTYCSGYAYLPEKVYIAKLEAVKVPEQTITTQATSSLEPVSNQEPVKVEEKVSVTQTVNTINREVTTDNTTLKEDPVLQENNITKTDEVPIEVREVISVLSQVDDSNIKEIKQESNLIYKDTNKDGISDYDSKYVYNIDPVKPSPVSVIDGKTVTASEKILLGFDPSKKDLVKIQVEEPTVSKAKSVLSYSVKKIEINKENKIAIKGKALPNSFITIYIYSTPIMVTVKTNRDGEWEYVLDKELEDGNHTIYAATVNNTGNIVAKSSAYTFTKTAEAVTLEDLPVTPAKADIEKPGIISGSRNLLMIGIGFFMSIGVILILVGLFTRGGVVKEGTPNQ